MAEVEDRLLEEAVLDQEQRVDHAAGTAVAVEERMDGLELVVAHGQADERVDRVVMDE